MEPIEGHELTGQAGGALQVRGAAATADELQSRLGFAGPGDPLGLGKERAPPPPDPDAFSPEEEETRFVRSLLGEEERAALEKEKEERGGRGIEIEEVRRLLGQNHLPGQDNLDPEVVAFLDARLEYKIFLDGDNAYTREELYEAYPFEELGTQPEAVFAQQEICIFPPRGLGKTYVYEVRDRGTPGEFVSTQDLVTAALRGGAAVGGVPAEKKALTKVWVGKEDWVAFKSLSRMLRLQVRLAQARGEAPRREQGGGALAALADEPAAAARAAEARAAEAEARARAAEERAARLEADIRRIEERLREE